MLDTILVPLDGSEWADAVLPHVVALTRINGTTVTLLHVLEADGHSTAGESVPDVDPVEWHLRKSEAQTYLSEARQRLEQENLTAEQVVLEGRVADRIVEYAQKEDMDLVVLSSHGQGGLSGWNISSVAQKVIHRVRKSTLIIPAHRMTQNQPAKPEHLEQRISDPQGIKQEVAGPETAAPDLTQQDIAQPDTAQKATNQQGYEQSTAGHRRPPTAMPSIAYRRLLVPLDGSPRAECVLPLATALARTFGAELILAHVVTKPQMIQRMPLSEDEKSLVNQVVERNRAEANRYFEQLQSRISPKPVTHVLEGDNVEYKLLELAEAESVDLVIMAAHGHTGHNSDAYGSLAARLIEHGSLPLYVHQDLDVNEITPLYAERMINHLAPTREQRINTYDYTAN